MSELKDLRKDIDAIDKKLVELFEERMAVTEKVGRLKREEGVPVVDEERQKQVLADRVALLADPSLAGDATDFFEGVMSISRRQQNRIIQDGQANAVKELPKLYDPMESPRVIYQGEPGAYSEEAAVGFFGEDVHRFQVRSFETVFTTLWAGNADYGVLPIENSSTGSVIEAYDLLTRYDAFVVGEQVIKVEHCLAAPKGTDIDAINEVYSQDQALFQCREFLNQHPDWTRTSLPNTATSAKYVSVCDNPRKACIASERAARLYGLQVLERGINYNKDNNTRFFVVAPRLERRADSNKISLIFTLPHEKGSLYKVMTAFEKAGVNLLKLESRPILGRSWEYRFFVDFTGHLDDPVVIDMLRQVMTLTSEFRILGCYRADA